MACREGGLATSGPFPFSREHFCPGPKESFSQQMLTAKLYRIHPKPGSSLSEGGAALGQSKKLGAASTSGPTHSSAQGCPFLPDLAPKVPSSSSLSSSQHCHKTGFISACYLRNRVSRRGALVQSFPQSRKGFLSS